MAMNATTRNLKKIKVEEKAATTATTSDASQDEYTQWPETKRVRRTNTLTLPFHSLPPPAFHTRTPAASVHGDSSLPSPQVPLPLFTNEILWVKHPDKKLSLVSLRNFLEPGARSTLNTASLEPHYANVTLFFTYHQQFFNINSSTLTQFLQSIGVSSITGIFWVLMTMQQLLRI